MIKFQEKAVFDPLAKRVAVLGKNLINENPLVISSACVFKFNPAPIDHISNSFCHKLDHDRTRIYGLCRNSVDLTYISQVQVQDWAPNLDVLSQELF